MAAILFYVSLPLLYFSRDTYTEPLSAMLSILSVALFLRAFKTANSKLFIASGVVAGSIALTRADGLFIGLCILLSIIIFQLIEIYDNKETIRLKSIFRKFNYGFVPVAFIGWLDMSKLSSVYYASHGDDLNLQLFTLVLLIVFSIVISNRLVRSRMISLINILKSKISITTIRRIIFSVSIIILIVLISRPLWYVGHDYSLPQVITQYIEGNQELEGLTIDGNRNYAELTMNWMMWYMGVVTSILALVGTVLALYLSIIKNNKSVIIVATAFLLPTVIFMMLVGITPDHFWASRRFLPITFPAIVFFAVFLLAKLQNFNYLKKSKNILILILCLISIISTYRVSEKYIEIQSYGGQFTQIKDVCSELSDEYILLWVGQRGWNSVQTVKAYCGVGSYRIEDPTDNDLKNFYTFAKTNNKTPVIVVTGFDYKNINIKSKNNFVEVSRNEFKTIPGRLSGLPELTIDNSISILIGGLDKNGSIITPINY